MELGRFVEGVATGKAHHPISRTRAPASMMVALLFVLLSPAVFAKQERLALVIGNASYDSDTFTDLGRGPLMDAEGMAARLSALGFVIVNPEGDGHPVLDANLGRMRNTLNTFTKRLAANPGAMGLVYFAGHGVSAKDDLETSEQPYLIPVGSPVEYESDAQVHALSVEQILVNLRAARVGIGIVVLDACRNTGLKSHFRSGGSRGLVLPPTGTGGVLVAYSTKSGSVAANRPDQRSIYTETLISHLGRPGVSLIDTFVNVRREVIRLSGQEPEAILQVTENPVLVPQATETTSAEDSTGSIRLESVPPGAAARIEGVLVGQTPVTVGGYPANRDYTVELFRKDYKIAREIVRVADRAIVEVSLTLQPLQLAEEQAAGSAADLTRPTIAWRAEEAARVLFPEGVSGWETKGDRGTFKSIRYTDFKDCVLIHTVIQLVRYADGSCGFYWADRLEYDFKGGIGRTGAGNGTTAYTFNSGRRESLAAGHLAPISNPAPGNVYLPSLPCSSAGRFDGLITFTEPVIRKRGPGNLYDYRVAGSDSDAVARHAAMDSLSRQCVVGGEAGGG